MAWNQPANNGQTYDQWDNKNNSVSKKGNYNIIMINFNNLFNNIFNILNNLNKKNKNNFNNQNYLNINKYFFLFIIIIIFIAWVVSGFYIIKESDCGVVFRFGKYSYTVNPGLNWKPNFIETVTSVNIGNIREQVTNNTILTYDKNIVQIKINVQYQITNPTQYLFNVTNPDNSLHQAIDSSVRKIISQLVIDEVLTTKRLFIRNEIQKELENIIKTYNIGITILDVNLQSIHPSEVIKLSFDNIITAQEEKQKIIQKAKIYYNKVLSLAKGNSYKIIEEAKAYKSSVILKAKSEIINFIKILPEYQAVPKIIRELLYIETIENILNNTYKIIINNKNNNELFLLLNQIINNIIKNKILDKQIILSKFINELDNYIQLPYLYKYYTIYDIIYSNKLIHSGR